MRMQLTSEAFENTAQIPSEYTCDGNRPLSPPLAVTDVPSEAKSLVLIMDDPDVPKILRPDGMFTHWILFNIPITTSEIPEGAEIGTSGVNTRGESGYTGPCPPPDYEPKTHRYSFKLFALDTTLNLSEGASKEDVEAAMRGHILVTAELIGTYSRA